MPTARITIDFGLVVLIWLVQLIVYPSFRYYNPTELAIWHPKYSNLITLIVGPLMLAQVALVGTELWQRFTWPTLLSAILVGLMWVATAFVSVPIHNAIAVGNASPTTLARLVDTNWLRTIGWTIIFLMGVIRH
ncbi:hypothetical protein [Fibrella aquatilis]|uniref:DUF1772 domain-containing protein n=1 Tax=Fibrella aquatilis TaxID=2817059 RepID=A0A939G3I2_9BACT|nr:hypothetical protein [Fibrella aquatilis]MBO0931216.1 hypothetical protein [Fibrella aquatilis]